MQLMTSLVRVMNTLADATETSQRQLDAEKRRKGGGRVRLLKLPPPPPPSPPSWRSLVRHFQLIDVILGQIYQRCSGRNTGVHQA